MTNKILRGTTAEHHGPVVVVRYTGDASKIVDI